MYNIVKPQRIVSGRPCLVVFILPYGDRTWMALSTEQEWTYLVENLLEWSRADLDSELRVKECGEPNPAHKLVPDCYSWQCRCIPND